MQQTAESTDEHIKILRDSGLDARLGDPRILVIDAENGRQLVTRAAERPGATASVMKIITSAASLRILGPNHRVATRVVEGSSPDEIVLVGGGDVTLSRVPGHGKTFYPSPGRLDDLAQQTLAALGGNPPKRVVLDASLFPGDGWHENWWPEGRDPDGYMPIIAALEVDGDRKDPVKDDSPRSEDPVQSAGEAFAEFLGGEPELVTGTAPENAKQLAEVLSAPVEALVRETLKSSDNALAEALARLCAHAVGDTANFAGLARTLRNELKEMGVPVEGVELIDGSGLSYSIKVPATTIVDVLRRARFREGVLGMLDDRLTKTGPEKTIASTRFTGKNEVVGDAVRAKTGFIGSVHSLAGIVRTVGGTDLIFAVLATSTNDESLGADARIAIDDFVTNLHLYGDSLSELEQPLHLDAKYAAEIDTER